MPRKPEGNRSKALADFQLLRRLEEANKYGACRCVTCGDWAPYKEMDGGHHFSRKINATAFDWRNVWPQCKRCNHPFSGRGMPAEYEAFLRRKFGREYESLKAKSKMSVSYTRDQLVDMRIEYRLRIRKVKKRKGI